MTDMENFEIILKNEKIKSYKNIAWIFLVLNFVVFIFLLFYDAYRPAALSFIVALSLYILLRWYLLKNNRANYLLDEFVFIIPAAGWFGLHNYVIAIACFAMGILYKLSLQQLKFVFSRQNVTKANFPKKEFDWSSFSNVVLKDNILTIDFKNNRLIQAEIEGGQSISEPEFNEFAQSRINLKENILQ